MATLAIFLRDHAIFIFFSVCQNTDPLHPWNIKLICHGLSDLLNAATCLIRSGNHGPEATGIDRFHCISFLSPHIILTSSQDYLLDTLGLRFFFFPPSLFRAATAFPKSETSSVAMLAAAAAFLPLPFPLAAAMKTLLSSYMRCLSKSYFNFVHMHNTENLAMLGSHK